MPNRDEEINKSVIQLKIYEREGNTEVYELVQYQGQKILKSSEPFGKEQLLKMLNLWKKKSSVQPTIFSDKKAIIQDLAIALEMLQEVWGNPQGFLPVKQSAGGLK